MKKKILAFLCCAVMVFALCGCSGESDNKEDDVDTTEVETETEQEEEAWRDAYKEVLFGVVAEDGEYAFDQEEYGTAEECDGNYQYALYDMDGDSIPELFVKFYTGGYGEEPIRVFTCEKDEVIEFEKQFYEGVTSGIKTSTQYRGIMSTSTDRWNGDTYYSVYEVLEGELVKVAGAQYAYDQTEDLKYKDTWSWVEWTQADDLNMLERYHVSRGEEKESITRDQATEQTLE